MKSLHKNRRGMTLTETIIVLGVIGVVLAGLWLAAANVNQKRKIQDAVDMVSAISSNVKSVFEGQARATPPSTTAQQLTWGLFPKAAENAAGTDTVNPWGGTYQIYFTSGSVYGFSVSVDMPAGMETGNTREACAALFTRLKPAGPAQGMGGGRPVSANPSASLAAGGGQESRPVAAYIRASGSLVEVTEDTAMEMAARLSGRVCNSIIFYYPL
jgi:prepilin-type N-terminal cleavage/methylation domain-containing protein